MFQGFGVFVLLVVCSWQDIKYKKICVSWLLYFMLASIGYHLFFQQQSFFEICIGMIPGLLLLLLSVVSHGGIGEGDGILLLALGIDLGVEAAVQMLLCASAFAALYALFIYLYEKKSRNAQIPFVPFLFLAFATELFVRR